MTIAEAERFYKQDKKEYDLDKNIVFLKWYGEKTKNSYKAFLDVEDLQAMIDFIVNWYEMKFPEREFEYYEGMITYRFENTKRISQYMTFEQLLYRLPEKILTLLQCAYSSCGGYCSTFQDEKDKTRMIWQNVIIIRSKTPRLNDTWNYKADKLKIYVDPISGKVLDTQFNDLLPIDREISLEKLLEILMSNKSKILEKFGVNNESEVDISELENSIKNHAVDIELRKMILQFVALKLIYSKNTVPENGYKRAIRFIGEFNKHLDLKLDSIQIEEIMQQDYSFDETKPLKKRCCQEDDNNSLLTVGDREIGSTRIKTLLKNIFLK